MAAPAAPPTPSAPPAWQPTPTPPEGAPPPGQAPPPPPWSAPAQGRGERPLGVTILAVLDALVGLAMVLGGIALATFGSVFGALATGPFAPFAVVGAVAIGGFMALLGAVFLFVAYGLWKGEGWAWTLSLVLVLIGLVMAFLSLLALDLSAVVNLLINGFLLWYLTRPGVQRWFGKAGAWPAPQVDGLLGRAGLPR